MLWFLLKYHEHRIEAISELKQRAVASQLTPDRYYYLVLASTGDKDRASHEKAKFVLDSTRPES